ncbi:MAG: outer membrane protein assembly factor BamD [Bernardetiaceae bacterium]|nr:outer membrane protein assembly factor BamD [Bernardetiaceae bacterium]
MRNLKHHLQIVAILICGTLLFSSCSKFAKAMKDPKWQNRYETAKVYYEKGDYYRASTLLEDIISLVAGTQEAEEIQFMYANAQFKQERFLMSAYYFKEFYRTYTRSDKAQEALYMHAISLYQDSPDNNLDQESTKRAITAFQDFINLYPESEFREQSNQRINELREKLEGKAYDNAYIYYKMNSHKAAVIAFESFKNAFPDSKRREEVSFLQIDAQYAYAKNSTFSKKKERYEEVIHFYHKFLDYFPESKYGKQVQNLYEQTLKGIENHNKEEKLREAMRKENEEIQKTVEKTSAGILEN